MLKWLILGLIIVAGLLYFFIFFIFTGIIKIDSTRPYGATVEIDGRIVGTTPIKRRVRTGTHQIKVFREGFKTWEGKRKVSTSALSVSVELHFLLRSKPSGATVTMDGEYVGETDMAIDLEPGAHSFEFKKDGYRSERFNAMIPSDASEPLPLVTLVVAEEEPESSTLEEWTTKSPPAGEYGTIQVTSRPDAQVSLDGYWKGETPLTIANVPVGSYVITLSREGYRDTRKTVYVKKDETTRFAGELRSESVDQ